jgi:hypothetical protein
MAALPYNRSTLNQHKSFSGSFNWRARVQSSVKAIKINRLTEYLQNEVIGFKIKAMKTSLAFRITLN